MHPQARPLTVIFKKTGAVVFLLFLVSGLLQAQFRPPVKERGSFSFSVENDVWLKQDDGYTNGVQIMWLTPRLRRDSGSGFMRTLWKLNNSILGRDDKRDTGVNDNLRKAAISLAQGMFTPRNLTAEELIPDDRPYAGLLYAALTLFRLNPGYQDSAGLAVGVVGPLSLAGAIQRWLHRTFDWTYPEGWGNQLRNEPVVEFWFNRLWILSASKNSSQNFSHLIRAGLGAQAGNLLAAVTGVFDLKIGFRADPTLEVYSAGPLFNRIVLGPAARTSVYAFIRVEGRAIGRNLLLQGNTFQESHGVDINPLYGQVSFGIAYHSVNAGICFYGVQRTKEFVGQKGRDPYLGLVFSFNL
ncbi:MAG: lipid A deacylase LpxR family protein [Candidatus Saccharicenans sp.]